MAKHTPLTGPEYSVLRAFKASYDSPVSKIMDPTTDPLEKYEVGLWTIHEIHLKGMNKSHFKNVADILIANGMIKQMGEADGAFITTAGIAAINRAEKSPKQGLLKDILIRLAHEFKSPSIPIRTDTIDRHIGVDEGVSEFLYQALQDHSPKLVHRTLVDETVDTGRAGFQTTMAYEAVCLQPAGKALADELIKNEGAWEIGPFHLKPVEAVEKGFQEGATKLVTLVIAGLAGLVGGWIAITIHNYTSTPPAVVTPTTSPVSITPSATKPVTVTTSTAPATSPTTSLTPPTS